MTTDQFPTGSLPTGAFDNAQAIWNGLLAMGLQPIAAAGVMGNIYQESHGNPGSASGAGGGLFGETIANGGSATGGTLPSQLSALQAYISKNGSIADVNANASTPQAAATYFSDKYERPGIPALTNRIDAAEWAYNAAITGNWNMTPGSSSGGGDSSDPFSALESVIGPAFQDFDKVIHAFIWMVQPGNWLRIIAGIFGAMVLGVGVYTLVGAAK